MKAPFDPKLRKANDSTRTKKDYLKYTGSDADEPADPFDESEREAKRESERDSRILSIWLFKSNGQQ